jgi:hypothetical protein
MAGNKSYELKLGTLVFRGNTVSKSSYLTADDGVVFRRPRPEHPNRDHVILQGLIPIIFLLAIVFAPVAFWLSNATGGAHRNNDSYVELYYKGPGHDTPCVPRKGNARVRPC